MRRRLVALGDVIIASDGNTVGRVIVIRPLGTVDIETADGSRWRVSGLPMVDDFGNRWPHATVRSER